jgi:drug/metabolite transporter (DMT)-like permease
MGKKEREPKEKRSWFDVLCMAAGVIGVLMTIKSVVLGTQSPGLFLLGIVTFCVALMMKPLYMVSTNKL